MPELPEENFEALVPSASETEYPLQIKLDPERLKRIAEVYGLTDRELEVLPLIPTALSIAEIAGIFKIAIKTAKNHLIHIYEKLGVTDREAAMAFLVQTLPISGLGSPAETEADKGNNLSAKAKAGE